MKLSEIKLHINGRDHIIDFFQNKIYILRMNNELQEPHYSSIRKDQEPSIVGFGISGEKIYVVYNIHKTNCQAFDTSISLTEKQWNEITLKPKTKRDEK